MFSYPPNIHPQYLPRYLRKADSHRTKTKRTQRLTGSRNKGDKDIATGWLHYFRNTNAIVFSSTITLQNSPPSPAPLSTLAFPRLHSGLVGEPNLVHLVALDQVSLLEVFEALHLRGVGSPCGSTVKIGRTASKYCTGYRTVFVFRSRGEGSQTHPNNPESGDPIYRLAARH